jgi:hypothetical protein
VYLPSVSFAEIKDRPETVSSDTQVSGGKREWKGNNQNSKKEALKIRSKQHLAPASLKHQALPNSTSLAAQRSRAAWEQRCRRSSKSNSISSLPGVHTNPTSAWVKRDNFDQVWIAFVCLDVYWLHSLEMSIGRVVCLRGKLSLLECHVRSITVTAKYKTQYIYWCNWFNWSIISNLFLQLIVRE